MPRNTSIRLLVAATAMMTALTTSSAVFASDDDNDSNDDYVQVMPFGFGMNGGMYMNARPIDTNSDGIISASEASLHASTGFALFDSDSDNQIEEDEYLDNAPSARPMGRRNVERLYVNRTARFKSMDADSDGKVTLAEFMAKAQASYEAADRNGDGKVTVWEFRAEQNPF